MSNKVPLAQATKESRKLKSVAKPKDMILDPMGQWKHPGENTRIPSNEITMQGVPYPVLAKPNVGQPIMMQPGAHYTFPGADYVDEFPKFAGGGMVEPTVDENGRAKCPDGYDYNSSTGYCEKKSSKCPDGYKPDGKGGCIEDRCQPGYIKDASGTCVPDTSGAIYVEDANDPRYQDYLTRKKLHHISSIEHPEIRDRVYRAQKQRDVTYDQFYDPEKGYTFNDLKTEDGRGFLYNANGDLVTSIFDVDPNKGHHGSKRGIYKGLNLNQARNLEAYARSKGFDMGDKFNPYSVPIYQPDEYTDKYKPSKFDADVYYFNEARPFFAVDDNNNFRAPRTSIVEDRLNRDRLKKYYPNITDADINDDYAAYYNDYYSNIIDSDNSPWPNVSADQNLQKQTDVLANDGSDITMDEHKKNIQDSAKAPNSINAPLNVTYDDNGDPTIKGRRPAYKPEEIVDRIFSEGNVLPYYDAPTDNYKFVTQPKSAELIQETQRAVPKYDEPELNLKKNNLPVFTTFGPSKDRKHIHYNNPFIVGTSNKPLNWAPYSAALRVFTGYKKGDQKKLNDEVKAAREEGRPVNFEGIPLMGKTDLKHRRAYKKGLKEYEKRQPEIDAYNAERQKEYEQKLLELTIYKQAEETKRKATNVDPSTITEWKKGGGLKSKKYSRSLQATNKFFRENPLFEKPKKLSKKRIYDPSAYYFQDGGLTLGTSTSYPSGLGVGNLANYIPSQMADLKLANSFKFKDVKTPLEISIGTPLGGANSRLNTYQGFEHPDDNASVLQSSQTPEQIITNNKANFNNWQETTKGAPIDFRVKQSFYGVPQDKNNPLRGFASVQGGYHPQTGFNAGAEGGLNLVLSRNGQANRYFSNRGLIPKQTVFVPQLTMGFGVKQKHKGWNQDTLNQYENLLNQDAQNNTTNSFDYLNEEGKKGHLTGSRANVAFRPQFTIESRPTRSPLTLHGTIGANINMAAGNRAVDDSGGARSQKSLYGEIGARYPVDKMFDKKSKAKSKIQEIQDREQEYERERPVKPVEQKEPEEQTEWIGEHPRWLQDGGEQDGMNGMMKARLAYANEFGNPAAKRMINIPDNPYQFENGDIGTHYMSSMDNYAVPQIQDENGQLMLGDYGPDSRETMRFDSDEDADYFAEHYKDVSPGFMELELSPEEIEEYAKGGYIVEDISVPELSSYAEGGQPCPPGQYWNGKECIDTITTVDHIPYRDKTGKPVKVLPKSGTIYVTDLNDPKILEYKKRQELYEMSKKQYSKILKDVDENINITLQDIKENQALLKEPGLTPKERANIQSVLNSDNAYLTKYKNEKTLLYDDWLIKSAAKLSRNNIGMFAQYNTYDQKKIYNKGVKDYKIYPDYTTPGSESDDRALLYSKPSLKYVFADPKNYIWNQPKVVETPPIIKEEPLPVLQPLKPILIPTNNATDLQSVTSLLNKDINLNNLELNTKKGNLPAFNYIDPAHDLEYIRLKKGTRPIAKWNPYSAALRMFTGYEGNPFTANPKEGSSKKELLTEIANAREEGRPVNLKDIPVGSKTELKHRRLYKKALKNYYEEENKKLNTYARGGEADYQLGDEIDEATMKRLKKLGYTFEEI